MPSSSSKRATMALVAEPCKLPAVRSPGCTKRATSTRCARTGLGLRRDGALARRIESASQHATARPDEHQRILVTGRPPPMLLKVPGQRIEPDTATLKAVATLAGEVDVPVPSRTSTDTLLRRSSTTWALQRRPLLPPDRVTALPPGTALLISGSTVRRVGL